MGFRDRLREPELRAVFDYWAGKRRGSKLPQRDDIDPTELPARLLPWLFLYRRELDERYRCILSGTGIDMVEGVDMTGRHLHEFEPRAEADELRLLFTQTLESGLPVCLRERRARRRLDDCSLSRLLLRHEGMDRGWLDGDEQACARLLLPVAGKRGIRNHILGVAVFIAAGASGVPGSLRIDRAAPEDPRHPGTAPAYA